MISTLQDLVKFTDNLFKELGAKEHFKDVLINFKVDEEKEQGKLNGPLSALPQTYCNVIKKLDITGVLLGGFCLSPYSLKKEKIEEQLRKAFDGPFFPKEFMDKHRMYQVGSCNTDLICVTAGTEKFTNGEVLLVEEGLDIYNPQDSQIHLLAKDFEQFLIIAGNFDQVRSEINEDESNYAEKKEKFLDRLKKLKIDEKYYSAWW